MWNDYPHASQEFWIKKVSLTLVCSSWKPFLSRFGFLCRGLTIQQLAWVHKAKIQWRWICLLSWLFQRTSTEFKNIGWDWGKDISFNIMLLPCDCGGAGGFIIGPLQISLSRTPTRKSKIYVWLGWMLWWFDKHMLHRINIHLLLYCYCSS